MKKKLTALVLASAMALGAGAFLAGCTQPEPEHTKHYDVDADGVCDVCSVDMEGHEHIYSKNGLTITNTTGTRQPAPTRTKSQARKRTTMTLWVFAKIAKCLTPRP